MHEEKLRKYIKYEETKRNCFCGNVQISRERLGNVTFMITSISSSLKE